MGLKKYIIIASIVVIAIYFAPPLDDLGNDIFSKLNENEIISLQSWAFHFQGKNTYETIWNIIFWQEDNIGYDYNKMFSHNSYIQSPTETYGKHSGTCIDYALLTACLLLGLHEDAYIFIIDGKNSYSGGHAFCAVNISGKFYAIDQLAPITDVDSHMKYFSKEHPDLNLNSIKVYYFYIPKNKAYDVKANMFEWKYNPNCNKKLSSEEKKVIENAVMNYFVKKYGLKPNSNINNMENMEYLPYGFYEGKYVYQPYECNLCPEFGEQYGRWLDRRLTGHLSLTEKLEGKKYEPINFKNYRYIWIKVDDKGGMGKIYIYLAK